MKHNGKHARRAEEKNGTVAVDMTGHSDNHGPDALKTLHLGKDCDYDKELRRLQVELVKLQEWIQPRRPAGGGAV